MSAAGSFMTSFANGYSSQRDRKAMAQTRDDARAALEASRSAEPNNNYDANYAGNYSGGGNVAPMTASDPVDTTMTPAQRATLNAIAAGESAGKYNVRYTPDGGTTFDLAGGHPRIYENGPAGKSSAAGRYQMVWSTWKDIAGADTPFTAANQDKYAWALAARDYASRTGRDLNADVTANGFTPEIASALAPTWTSLRNPAKAQSTYADSIARYSQPAASNVVPFTPPASRSLAFAGIGQPASSNVYPIGIN